MQFANTEIPLLKALSIQTSLSLDELSSFFQSFHRISYPKNHVLLEAGNTTNELYFILKGYLRLYYLKDGNDRSAYFFTEGVFAGAYHSFIRQQKSRHYIVCAEDCILLVIKHKDYLQLLTQAKADLLIRKVLEERFFALHDLFTAQILDSPEERYLYLLQEQPQLIHRVPQHQLATFLGITAVSLSRIRARIKKS